MPTVPGSPNRASEYRSYDDAYSTPRCASVPFLRAYKLVSKEVWEPACGSGALSKVLAEFNYKTIDTTLVDYDWGIPKINFMFEKGLRAPVIITNPPFNIVDNFVLHALRLEPLQACFFLRTKFLEGKKRYERLLRNRPPRFIYQFVERIKFFSDSVPREQQPGWNTEAFAWFVWEKGWHGEPRVRWLRRGEVE